MAFDVFISYSKQDRTVANAVCGVLEQHGIRCWIAPRDVEPGRDWASCIIAALNQCSVVVLVFSSHANASPQVRREVQRAFEKSVTVIPFRVEDVMPAEALEYYIGPVHWLDALAPPMDEHLRKLAESVRRNLTSRSGDVATLEPEEPRPAHHESTDVPESHRTESAPAAASETAAQDAEDADVRPAPKERVARRSQPEDGPKKKAKKRRRTASAVVARASLTAKSDDAPAASFAAVRPPETRVEDTAMPSRVRLEFETTLKMAERSRDPATMVRLARMYRDGHLGWGRDEHRAVEWFRWAAETAKEGSWLESRFSDASDAHATAMNELAQMYEQGRGVAKDVNEAIRWYRLATKRWFSDAAKSAKASLQRLGVPQ